MDKREVVREKLVVRVNHNGVRSLVRFVKYKGDGCWSDGGSIPLPYGVPNKLKKLGPWKKILLATIVLES